MVKQRNVLSGFATAAVPASGQAHANPFVSANLIPGEHFVRFVEITGNIVCADRSGKLSLMGGGISISPRTAAGANLFTVDIPFPVIGPIGGGIGFLCSRKTTARFESQDFLPVGAPAANWLIQGLADVLNTDGVNPHSWAFAFSAIMEILLG